MTKHSPLIALQNAQRALNVAYQCCPHWDYESDEFVGADCCYALREAREKVRRAKRAVEKANREYPAAR
jgi:hypothetical protein